MLDNSQICRHSAAFRCCAIDSGTGDMPNNRGTKATHPRQIAVKLLRTVAFWSFLCIQANAQIENTRPSLPVPSGSLSRPGPAGQSVLPNTLAQQNIGSATLQPANPVGQPRNIAPGSVLPSRPANTSFPNTTLPPGRPFNPAPSITGGSNSRPGGVPAAPVANGSFGQLIPLGQPTLSTTPPPGSSLTLPNGQRVTVPNSVALPNQLPATAQNFNPLNPQVIRPNAQPLPPNAPVQGFNGRVLPSTGFPNTNLPNPGVGFNNPLPGSPQYNPNATFPNSIYPNQTPPTLFPGFSNSSAFGGQPGRQTGPLFNEGPGFSFDRVRNWWRNLFNRQSLNPSTGNLGTGWINGGPNGPIWNGQPQQISAFRFFQGPRFRHTFVQGDSDPTALATNDTDVSLAFAIPNFLGSLQPLYIAPSFSLHLWDGPNNIDADLPGSAYSAFLDTGWQTDPVRTFGLDLGVRVGVFSDFDTFNSDTIRVLGKALGRVRLTPNSTLRLGVYYVDRNEIKLIPAGGVLWTPNPDTRFDLFFPEPKLSHYLTTLGTQDVWWYAGANYGGGSWTITRADQQEDSVDLNEVRLVVGAEWGRNESIRQGQRLGFAEIGFAFARELRFRFNPGDDVDLDDSFVVRLGFGY